MGGGYFSGEVGKGRDSRGREGPTYKGNGRDRRAERGGGKGGGGNPTQSQGE